MIIEQIRYYVADDDRDTLITLRREVSRIRTEAGIGGGKLLISDPAPDEGPSVVWQCGYRDESEMALAETRLLGHEQYVSTRQKLGSLAVKIELEIYTAEEDEG